MGLFDRKIKIADSGLLDGYTEYHCHILPAVDDGFQKIEDSLQILSEYEAAGVKRVWFTPHIMEDVPNTVEGLREQFEAFKMAYKGGIELCLASENMLDNLFEERLSDKSLLSMDGNYLLVETSYFSGPMNLTGMLDRVKSAGYFPILAHPERYIYMSLDDYKNLKNRGILFQMNLTSIAGFYGPVAQSKAEWLLKEGFYDYMGTDLHRISTFHHLMEAKLPKSVLKRIAALKR